MIRVKYVHDGQGSSQLFSCTKCNVSFLTHAGICFHISEKHPNVDPMVPMCMKGKVLTKAERKKFEIKKRQDEKQEPENTEVEAEVIGVVEVIEMAEVAQEQQEHTSMQGNGKENVLNVDADPEKNDEVKNLDKDIDGESHKEGEDSKGNENEEKIEAEENGVKDQISEYFVRNQKEEFENVNVVAKSKEDIQTGQDENAQAGEIEGNNMTGSVMKTKVHKRRKPQRVTMKTRKRIAKKTPNKSKEKENDVKDVDNSRKEKGKSKKTQNEPSKEMPLKSTKVKVKKSKKPNVNANDSSHHARLIENRKGKYEAGEKNKQDSDASQEPQATQEDASFFISCSEAAKLRRNSRESQNNCDSEDSGARKSPEGEAEMEAKNSAEIDKEADEKKA